MTRAEILDVARLLPEHERAQLRADLTATLPLPACYVATPALIAAGAKRLNARQVEELIALLQKGRAS